MEDRKRHIQNVMHEDAWWKGLWFRDRWLLIHKIGLVGQCLPFN